MQTRPWGSTATQEWLQSNGTIEPPNGGAPAGFSRTAKPETLSDRPDHARSCVCAGQGEKKNRYPDKCKKSTHTVVTFLGIGEPITEGFQWFLYQYCAAPTGESNCGLWLGRFEHAVCEPPIDKLWSKHRATSCAARGSSETLGGG